MTVQCAACLDALPLPVLCGAGPARRQGAAELILAAGRPLAVRQPDCRAS